MHDFKKASTRGGKRAGAGRPDQGKGRYTVTLTSQHVDKAKKREPNFSGLLDRLLADWIGTTTAKLTRENLRALISEGP